MVIKTERIADCQLGLLYRDRTFVKVLEPGVHRLLRINGRFEVIKLDLRPLPLKAVSLTADLKDHLYKELQFALRQVVGTRTLDEVLGDKLGINEAIAERLLPSLAGAGLDVSSVGVKDIILPVDVRELMNRVIEAEKTAQANVIKRREETAATRSLLNTAKLMEDNPTLMRLKELEALEKVSEKVGNVVVGTG